MLFAVEGGGFFSASASGYSKGLTLLLLSQRKEERPMKVSPWNQYQLVEEEIDPDIQRASRKHEASHGCASFVCFGCAPTGLDGPSSPKVGSVHHSETPPDSSTPCSSDKAVSGDAVDENDPKLCLRSSLKRPTTCCSIIGGERDDARDSLEDMESSISCCTESRKVQWTDACGRELVEIREFELSDYGASDDEYDHGRSRKCECVIQ